MANENNDIYILAKFTQYFRTLFYFTPTFRSNRAVYFLLLNTMAIFLNEE